MFKTMIMFLAAKSITDAAFNAMNDTEKLELYKEYNEEMKANFESAVSKMVSREEFENAQKSNDLEAVKSLATKLEADVAALKETPRNAPEGRKTLAGALKEVMSNIRALATGSEKAEVVVKADTLRANVLLTQQATDLPEVGQLPTRKLSLYDIFPKIQLGTNNNGTVRYYDWDEETTVRAAAYVAEGQPFPQSTAKWKRYSLELVKVGDTLPVSEEFYEDEVMFASELELFLATNVNLVIDNGLANGTGLSNTLKGMFASVPAFSTALATTTVEAPTIYDLIAIATEQITITGGGKYMPDTVFMNKATINKMRLSKDANENYIIPPFVSADGREIDGMLVIESNVIPNNQMIIGDKRFGRIYEKNGLVMSRGHIGDQFAEDMETLKVRKRLLFLIREVDKTGFVKITNINTALAAITAS